MQTTLLNDFFSEMVLDPAKLAAYVADPQGTMKAAGLGADDQRALESADQATLHARVAGGGEAAERAHKVGWTYYYSYPTEDAAV
jgi:hypothetical protein